MDLSVVILAGGKGTRLSGRIGNIPKPMAPFSGRTIIEYQLAYCRAFGLSSIHILGGHLGEKLRDYIDDIKSLDQDISFVIEDEPRGTGGALLDVIEGLSENILVIYGDTFLTVDLDRFVSDFLNITNCENLLGQILVHPNSHPDDSDLVILGEDNFVEAIEPYPREGDASNRNLVNAALCIFKKSSLLLLKNHKLPRKFDIARDLLSFALTYDFKIKATRNVEFIKDLGTPDRIENVESKISEGSVANVSFGYKSSAVFLDRDGCIVEEVGYVTRPEQLRLISGAARALRQFNEQCVPVFCVTNQPVVARGDVSIDELNTIHARLDSLLGDEGSFIDKLVFCPHHPDSGFDGEISALKMRCGCRKPEIGLIHTILKEYTNVEASDSWFIGDTNTDMQTARNAGMRSVLVRTGFGGRDSKPFCKPDYVFDDLMEASNFILEVYPRVRDFVLNNLPSLRSGNPILIGGLSRAGKSTFAQAVQHVLHRVGLRCQLINADHWLKSKAERVAADTVQDMYDLDDFSHFISDALEQRFPKFFRNSYRDVTRDSVSEFATVIHRKSIVIVEGCATALLPPDVLEKCCFIWVDVNEDCRTQRFYNKYKSKDLKNKEISSLYSKRKTSEDSQLLSAFDFAHLVWSDKT